MAIQHRRGDYNDYRPNKMLSGELAVTLQNDPKAVDGKALHVAFGPSTEKTLMTFEDAEGMVEDATVIAIAGSVEKASGEARAWAHGDSFAKADIFSGDGSTTSFSLTYAPSSITSVRVDDAVITSYSLSGNVITFTNAPITGTANIIVEYIVNNSTDNAKYYKEQAGNSASSAASSESSAASSASTASTAASSASSSASTASSSATTATTQATKAESYAVGGTGSRTGEDTDNAKYYKEQAEAAAALVDAEKILGDFASFESTTTASKAYKVGEYLTYDGYLYKVTTAIASGGTITVGTNVVRANVGDEIANRNLFFKDQAVSAVTGNILVISDDKITADHVLTECVWANPSNITTDVTWTTAAGSLTLNGKCTAATTATVTLVKKDN